MPVLLVRLSVLILMTIITAGAALPVTNAGPAQSSSADLYKSVYNGWKLWHVYCYRCHGMNAIATTLAPSLIDPDGQFSRAEFQQIVLLGNPKSGMPAWNKLLDNRQIADIQTYVKARADKVLPPGRPDEVGPNGGPWPVPAGWRRPQ